MHSLLSFLTKATYLRSIHKTYLLESRKIFFIYKIMGALMDELEHATIYLHPRNGRCSGNIQLSYEKNVHMVK